MFMKKNGLKEKDLHLKQAINVTRNIFCENCIEKEGHCLERYSSEIPRCYTFRCVMNRIRKIFDRFDR